MKWNERSRTEYSNLLRLVSARKGLAISVRGRSHAYYTPIMVQIAVSGIRRQSGCLRHARVNCAREREDATLGQLASSVRFELVPIHNNIQVCVHFAVARILRVSFSRTSACARVSRLPRQNNIFER